MLMTPAALNTDATAFQHSKTLYFFFFVAVYEYGCTSIPCIISHFEQNGESMSHNVTRDSGNSFGTFLNNLRSERAPPYFNFCELPSHIFLPTMHTLCCISAVNGQCWVQFSQITPLQWIKLKLRLVGFPKMFHHLRCIHMFLIFWDEMCNHHDGDQITFELSALSPYMMQTQHSIMKPQH